MEKNKKGSLELRLQDYLSIGYLFLLIVGLLRDAIFYSFIGINILDYAGITDVLVSPLAYTIDQPFILVLLISLVIFVQYQRSWHEKLKGKKWYQKFSDIDKLDGRLAKSDNTQGKLIFVAIVVGSLLLGSGIGAGGKLSRLIDSKELQIQDRLELLSGESLDGRIVGQNSSYVFFVEKGNDFVDALPVQGVIKKIQKGKLKSD